MQLKRSLLALFLILLYFAAAGYTLFVVSLALALKICFIVCCAALLFFSIKNWLVSAGTIIVTNGNLTLKYANKSYNLDKIKYHLDCCLYCSVQQRRRKIVIWRDQLAADDYRQLRGLLLAFK